MLNALKVVGKDLRRVRIVMVGMGAANVAGFRLLTSSGVGPGTTSRRVSSASRTNGAWAGDGEAAAWLRQLDLIPERE